MNTDFDELLRDGMERFTTDLHAPANLATRARRSRRQRLTLRSTVGGVAAAAVAAGVFAALPSTTAPVTLGSPTAPIAERHDIEHIHLTRSALTSDQIWVYRHQFRQLVISLSGHPIEDIGSNLVKAGNDGHKSQFRTTVVDFSHKTWGHSRQPYSLTAPDLRCHPLNLFSPPGPSALPAWIRGLHKLIHCGALVVAGTEQIDGVKTIKLRTTSLKDGGQPAHAAIWVKRTDYVPVRLAGSTAASTWRIDLSWLRPTKANLALLQVPIPAGFRKVAISQPPGTGTGSCHTSSSHPRKPVCTHSG